MCISFDKTNVDVVQVGVVAKGRYMRKGREIGREGPKISAVGQSDWTQSSRGEDKKLVGRGTLV